MASALPPLDPTVFSASFFRSILDFWYDGVGPNETTLRWFGRFEDDGAKEAHDARCWDIAAAALAALHPSVFPLPPRRSGTGDRAQAAALSAPLRARLATVATKDLPLPDATVAMMLLLDQFPRNCYRDPAGLALVYQHFDRLALSLARFIFDDGNTRDPLHGIDRDPAIRHMQTRRQFLYLPLQHSEDLADHDVLTARGDDVWQTGSAEEQAYLANADTFEATHRELLERFGRYPHRNEALGRTSTPEERAYLDGGGHTFGVKASTSG